MIEPSVFLRKTSLRSVVENRVSGESVLDSYASVVQRLATLAGTDVAELFARPAVTRGNGETETTVAWYVAKGGAMRDWSSLSSQEQLRIANDIGHLLDRLRAHLGDAQIGQQLRGWLAMPALDNNIVLLDDRPYLINWGMLPGGIVHDAATVEAHHKATLGLFGGMVPAAASAGAAAAEQTKGTPKAARGFSWGRRSEGATGGIAQAATTGTETRRRRDWIAVAIAAGVAGLALLISFIPGVLLRDEWRPPVAPQIDENVRRQSLEAAERRIQQLRAQLNEQVCRPVAPAPGAPPPPALPGQQQRGALPGIQPSPASLPAPQNGTMTRPPSDLKEYIIQATALVIVDRGDEQVTGTAFFVNERQLVTNRHVVEGAPGGAVRVVTPSAGGTTAGRVIAITPPRDANDFAVIEIQSANEHPVIPIQDPAEQLQDAISSGFPSLAVASDDTFKRAVGGDRSALPRPVLTRGIVTATLTEQATPRIVHSATILPGNSGGPLVDTCGRLLGVNTAIRVSQEMATSLNYALASRALRDFLVSKGISFTSDKPCPLPAPEPAATNPAAPATAAPAGPTPANPAPASPAPPARPNRL